MVPKGLVRGRLEVTRLEDVFRLRGTKTWEVWKFSEHPKEKSSGLAGLVAWEGGEEGGGGVCQEGMAGQGQFRRCVKPTPAKRPTDAWKACSLGRRASW